MFRKSFLLLVPLIVFFVIWGAMYRSPYVFFSPEVQTSTFTDREIDGGQSVILGTENAPNHKSIQFELKKGFISPYAGMSFFMEKKYFDLTPYNEIEIEVELQNTKNLELTLATYQDGVTKENEPLTFRHNVMEIPILDHVTRCTLPLDRVQIAQWWLEKFKLRSTELGSTNWSKTKSISVVAKIRLDNNQPQFLKINKLLFKRNLTLFYIVSFVLAVFWYGGLLLYSRLFSAKKNPLQKKADLPNEMNHGRNKEFDQIRDYVVNNYTDPDLTLGKMSESLKVQEKTISGLIKKNFAMTFKEYLNDVRLAEAKKLLDLADKNISEIAYEVGFNSPNHFNRTFKSNEGCTPTEYRSQRAQQPS